VSYLFVKNNLNLTTDASSHVAGRFSPADYVQPKALYMIIKSAVDS
jgi:hypothetical protein